MKYVTIEKEVPYHVMMLDVYVCTNGCDINNSQKEYFRIIESVKEAKIVVTWKRGENWKFLLYVH